MDDGPATGDKAAPTCGRRVDAIGASPAARGCPETPSTRSPHGPGRPDLRERQLLHSAHRTYDHDERTPSPVPPRVQTFPRPTPRPGRQRPEGQGGTACWRAVARRLGSVRNHTSLAAPHVCGTGKGGQPVKFRVERDVLAEAVTWAARGLPNRPPVPVLAGVLIEASDDGTLTLSAFDYEVSARITVAAEVAEPGTVLVLGRLLADISRNLPARPIDVATDGNKVQVTCGSSRFSLLMMPSDDYPTLPASPAPTGTIAGDVFTQAVAQVEHRRRSRRHAAHPHRCPARDRRRQGHAACHRPLPAGDARAHLEPRGDRRQLRGPRPRAHPVRHRQGSRRLRLGGDRPRQLRRRRRAHRLRGRPAPGHHPPAGRRVPQGRPRSSPRAWTPRP